MTRLQEHLKQHEDGVSLERLASCATHFRSKLLGDATYACMPILSVFSDTSTSLQSNTIAKNRIWTRSTHSQVNRLDAVDQVAEELVHRHGEVLHGLHVPFFAVVAVVVAVPRG